MTSEFQLWAVSDSNGEATQVESRVRADTERLLEDTLVNQPSMLMPGLTLVGRQTPVAGGYLDLLGIDSDGRLVVFELKRGTLTRDAVAQVIDYASDLESRDIADLYEHIADRSGSNGIDRIEDFDDWYSQRFEGQNLKPVRMALVGLGVDDNATRMVKYLANQGAEIDLLMFQAFEHNGQTFLARRVEWESPAPGRLRNRRTPRVSDAERRKAIEEHFQSMGITYIDDVLAGFRGIGDIAEGFRSKGFTYLRPKLVLPGQATSFYNPHSVWATEPGKLRITFFPVSVHLCQEEFEAADYSIQFQKEPPPNAPPTDKVGRQWFCVLDEAGWKEHKDTLLGLASSVYNAWDDARRGNFIGVEPISKE